MRSSKSSIALRSARSSCPTGKGGRRDLARRSCPTSTPPPDQRGCEPARASASDPGAFISARLANAFRIGVDEIRRRLAAAREGFHRLLVQKRERLHLDMIGVVIHIKM